VNIKLVTVALTGCLLAGCAANEKLVPDPTYKGNLTLVRLQDTDFTLEDSADVPFDDLFVGFEPSSSLFVPGFPRSRFRFDIGLVSSRRYQLLFRGYDANGNDFLERPEMAVMYVQETALGLGHPVIQFNHNSERIEALQIATADLGGLMRFIDANSRQLDPKTRQLFRDMPNIVEDIRSAQEGGRRFR